jgi:hypothetical protein
MGKELKTRYIRSLTFIKIHPFLTAETLTEIPETHFTDYFVRLEPKALRAAHEPKFRRPNNNNKWETVLQTTRFKALIKVNESFYSSHLQFLLRGRLRL